jgi:hypothetical protein
MRTCARWLPLLAAMFTLAGCIYVGDWGDSDAYRTDFHSTYPLNSGGRVTVESFNGSIDLAGWDQNSVEVNGTKHASSRGALDDLKIDIRATPDSVRIRAIRGSDTFSHGGVRFSIRVPRKALLDLISSSNGKIDVEDAEGGARLHTSNGGIRVIRCKGDVRAQTSNASIDAQEVSGNVDFHTTNGSVRTETSGGSLEASTSNGSITARLTNPDASSPIRLNSSNGHIELTVDARELPEIRASTSNSSILLRLPVSTNARVRASTSSHSPITTEFDELRGDRSRHHSDLEGTIGRGGPLLDLRTTNGSIRILKM